jgi:hypothetical protein
MTTLVHETQTNLFIWGSKRYDDTTNLLPFLRALQHTHTYRMVTPYKRMGKHEGMGLLQ